jgi:hypothetical protein
VVLIVPNVVIASNDPHVLRPARERVETPAKVVQRVPDVARNDERVALGGSDLTGNPPDLLGSGQRSGVIEMEVRGESEPQYRLRAS